LRAINQKITINHTIVELLNNTININEKNNGMNNDVNNGNFERPYCHGIGYWSVLEGSGHLRAQIGQVTSLNTSKVICLITSHQTRWQVV